MCYILYLDDERFPKILNEKFPGIEIKIARTAQEGLSIIKEFGIPIHMSIDHDLGHQPINGDIEQDGSYFMRILEEMAYNSKIKFDKNTEFNVHSAHIPKRKSLYQAWENILRFSQQ